MSLIMNKAKELTMRYLLSESKADRISQVLTELTVITGDPFWDTDVHSPLDYTSVQDSLATLNEKEYIRKRRGVYYTPLDVVAFIIANTVKMQQGRIDTATINGTFPPDDSITKKNVLDPTCGAGEFLLAFLDAKFCGVSSPTKAWVRGAVRTIYGNDTNPESTTIAKIRLLLCVYHTYGDAFTNGVGEILNRNFSHHDFIAPVDKAAFGQYDFIVGNPPYIEDSKCETPVFERYGNIYCNVLDNAVHLLKKGGVMGFILPLSYISTPRMYKIRARMTHRLKEQLLLSYADRPDCLFTAVHQKLCILIGNEGSGGRIITSGYHYWYKNERPRLFDEVFIHENTLATDECIPKIGLPIEERIFHKIVQQPHTLSALIGGNGYSVYLNMRACFWIKAFTAPHVGAEYKEYGCNSAWEQQYAAGILNCSLFWWYWVSVSDCWHITKKELKGFKVPPVPIDPALTKQVQQLEHKLELTKKYVGTKQTDYEYKHKSCLPEIESLDKTINALYGLTEEESAYIIDFAKKYRTGGTAE